MNQYWNISLLLISLCSFFLSTFAMGEDLLEALRKNQTYKNYYAISMQKTFSSLDTTISLLEWDYHQDSKYVSPKPYERTRHFKSWINDPSHESCFDVRSLVLLRQAQAEVITHPKNHCVIYKSKWYDPYSDHYFYHASDLQVDHVVPLKNAYLSGAWTWSAAKRCHYANFLNDPFHLLVVEGRVNQSKGESGPDHYLPKNPQFQCMYISIWLRIKAFWKLKIAVPEAEAIRQYLTQNSCPKEYFTIDANELAQMQKQTEQPPAACL